MSWRFHLSLHLSGVGSKRSPESTPERQRTKRRRAADSGTHAGGHPGRQRVWAPGPWVRVGVILRLRDIGRRDGFAWARRRGSPGMIHTYIRPRFTVSPPPPPVSDPSDRRPTGTGGSRFLSEYYCRGNSSSSWGRPPPSKECKRGCCPLSRYIHTYSRSNG